MHGGSLLSIMPLPGSIPGVANNLFNGDYHANDGDNSTLRFGCGNATRRRTNRCFLASNAKVAIK